MIPLSPDPVDMPKGMPDENCCFCGSKTRMWFAPKDVPVCTACAELREPSQVPDKEAWCDSPQSRGIHPDRVVSDLVLNEQRILIYKDAEGVFHLDSGDRRDIHGPMKAEAVIAWMSNVIHNLSHIANRKA